MGISSLNDILRNIENSKIDKTLLKNENFFHTHIFVIGRYFNRNKI